MKRNSEHRNRDWSPWGEAVPEPSRRDTEDLVKVILAASLALLALLLAGGQRTSIRFRDLPVLGLPSEPAVAAPERQAEVHALNPIQEVSQPPIHPSSPVVPALDLGATKSSPEDLETLIAHSRRWIPESPSPAAPSVHPQATNLAPQAGVASH